MKAHEATEIATKASVKPEIDHLLKDVYAKIARLASEGEFRAINPLDRPKNHPPITAAQINGVYQQLKKDGYKIIQSVHFIIVDWKNPNE